jgi:ABC-type uncharacterized transport system substrate-binding protein
MLKGDKSAYLPVQRATRFTLTINMKTTKTLGLGEDSAPLRWTHPRVR